MILTENQVHALSGIAENVGMIALGSVVLPAVLDNFDSTRAAVGLIITFYFWSLSLVLKK